MNRDLERIRERIAGLHARMDRAELEASVFDRPIPRDVLRGVALDAKFTVALLRLAIGR